MAFVGLKIQVMGPGGKPAWLKKSSWFRLNLKAKFCLSIPRSKLLGSDIL